MIRTDVRALILALSLTSTLGAAPPIRVGHYGSMSGSMAAFGDSTDKAIRLAVEQVNARGGVLGRSVEVFTEDDQSNPDQVLPGVIRLVDRHKVDVILGEVSSSLTLIGAPFCQERRIPMVTPSSVARAITQKGDFIFRVCFTDAYQGRAAALFARRDLDAKRMAVLVDQGNDYSKGMAAEFRSLYEATGGEVVAELSYRAGDKDFRSQLTRFAELKPDAILVPSMYGDVPGIARQARGLGLNIPLIGGDGWDAQELVTIGGEAVEGHYFTTHYAPDSDDSAVRRFADAFASKYGAPPDGIAALGYDAALLVLDAIARAGSTDRDAVRKALASTRGFQGVTGTINMGPERNPVKSVMVLQVRDGRFRFFREIEPDAILRAAGQGGGSARHAAWTIPSRRVLLQQVANGLSLGAIYGLIAVGYTIVYGILRLINFAHGDVFMLGPVVVIGLAPWLVGLGGGLASGLATFAAAMALCGLAGFGLERAAYRPLRRPYAWRTIIAVVLVGMVLANRIESRPFRLVAEIGILLYAAALVSNNVAATRGVGPSGRLVPLITAIGASLFIEYTTQHRALFGNRPRGFPGESLGLSAGAPIRLGELVIDRLDLLVIGVTTALVAVLTLIVRRTRIGLAMRAVSDNPDSAVLMGIDPDRVVRFCFVLGGALAGAAGVLWAMKYPAVDPLMGIMPGLKAFVAAVIGGIGSLPGALLGGLVMGLAEAFLAASPVSEYKDALAFVLLIGVLLLRPSGLLGRRLPEKV